MAAFLISAYLNDLIKGVFKCVACWHFSLVFLPSPSQKLSNEKGIWQKEYLYFNAQLIAMIDYSGVGNAVTNDSAGQIYYAHNDHLGTPKLLTNSAAKPVWQASYTPFGLAIINADVDNNGVAVTLNIRFPGQYYDAESGLHYNWFRYYDPTIGRYVTSDPIGLAGD